ncbi:nucleoid occlusion factor SlmA [Saccharobesus litoralis]|uniref:Nucleoid occlusion factor SlmA n=1 Tax=Saccharobesus litoralis TaxID=2172099 RepID=A0A2S0VRU4_9ALTE|nr:nucleoid occlusion factor SlmA [Saccharobesus litoralis]AWB66913.1 nucleoid occlusion factor SlmA [Saccharobesus litoralis]
MPTQTKKKGERKHQILQALAQMLETNPGERITTAKLATAVGVTEAALYRHFPSKARMYEGLLDFIEDSILGRINTILEEEKQAAPRSFQACRLVILFAERNPGISRLLSGEALMGEQARLRERVNQFYDKLEVQFKQILRERKLREGKDFPYNEAVVANQLVCWIAGHISQFVRSDYQKKPSEHLLAQWAIFESVLFANP